MSCILQAESVFVRDGMEFVVCRVKGQSFMLHQIRKMIGNSELFCFRVFVNFNFFTILGILIALTQGLVKEDYFEYTFGPEKVRLCLHFSPMHLS